MYKLFLRILLSVAVASALHVMLFPSRGAAGSLVSAATFSRSSAAYHPATGLRQPVDDARYGSGRFSQGILIEEGTINRASANQSDLETDASGWSAFNSATIAQDPSVAWTGNASLKVVSASSNQGAYARVPVTLASGAKYTLLQSSDWQQVQITAVAPVDTWEVVLVLQVSAETGVAWFDDIQAEPSFVASTTFSPGPDPDQAYYYRVTGWNGPLYGASEPVLAGTAGMPASVGTWRP